MLDRVEEPRAGIPTRRIYGVLEPVNAISNAGTPKREITRLFVVSIATQLLAANLCESLSHNFAGQVPILSLTLKRRDNK